MMVRTTKQIIDADNNIPFEILMCGTKFREYKNSEWVLVSDLKKEIDEFLHDYEVENIKYCELQEEIYKRLGLCNSSEQNVKPKNYSWDDAMKDEREAIQKKCTCGIEYKPQDWRIKVCGRCGGAL